MSLQQLIQDYSKDVDSIQAFCDDLYQNLFSYNFAEVRKLYQRMQSEHRIISDDELTYILTELPIELFTIAENLNKLRLQYEVVKLKNKERIAEIKQQLYTTTADSPFTKAEKQELIQAQIAAQSSEYDILASAYACVISRVESEQSFSRELIMGAKKIWDSRRSSELSNPVSPTTTELPEYKRKQYIQ